MGLSIGDHTNNYSSSRLGEVSNFLPFLWRYGTKSWCKKQYLYNSLFILSFLEFTSEFILKYCGWMHPLSEVLLKISSENAEFGEQNVTV